MVLIVRRDAHMTANGHHIVRLEFTSAFEMLDFVQVVSDHLARGVGLDEDSLHWVSVAIRESVINAIKHGNRNDAAQARLRRVRDRRRTPTSPELTIRVRDQGDGFDPGDGRQPARRPRTCSSRAAAASSSSATSWTTCSCSARRKAGWKSGWSSACSRPTPTASVPRLSAARPAVSRPPPIEAVVRAGDLQMAQFGRRLPDRQEGHDRSRHRGRRRGRADVPRADRRALSRSRRSSPRSWAARRRRPPGPCWVFDPIDGTTNFAHGLPIFCASLALEIDGVAEVARGLRSEPQGAVHRRARRRRVPERRAAARVVGGARSSTRCSSPDFPTTSTRASTRSSACSRAFVGQARAVRRLGSAAIDLCYVAAGRHGRLLGERPEAVGHRRRRADRGGGRRAGHRT